MTLALVEDMAETKLRAGASPQKRGVVVVRNGDGSFNREIALTGAQYAALGQPGAGAPPGVTREEWESGRAVAFGKDYDVGDAASDAAGNLTILYKSRVVNGETIETYLEFAPGEWTGTPPRVTVSLSALLSLPANQRPSSIVLGTITD